MPAITTKRLRLRALESGDRALFHELYGDVETMRYIGRPASRKENDASFRATLQELHQPRKRQFIVIVRKRGDKGIGIFSISHISARGRSAQIGIMLVRAARGYGYALEARMAFVDAVFRRLPIDTIWVQNRKSNVDVARLNAKLGFSDPVGWRPRGVRRGCCVKVLRRSTWCLRSTSPDRSRNLALLAIAAAEYDNVAASRQARESLPALTTARLRLRAVEPGDRALFQELYTDRETMRFIGRPATRSEISEGFRATLRALHRQNKPQFLTLIKKRGGKAIGLCSIRSISPRERSAEIGIMLVQVARGYGYAAEGLSALIEAIFRVLPIDRIWAQYHHANAAVACLFDVLGFSVASGRHPEGAEPGLCVRIMWRSAWRKQLDQLGGRSMSKIIGFLENAGRNAAMRHATRERLLQMMECQEIAPVGRAAMLQSPRSVLDSLLGARETMYCQNVFPKTPLKAPPKKTPVKAPPKKVPGKKPVKKAPAKKR